MAMVGPRLSKQAKVLVEQSVKAERGKVFFDGKIVQKDKNGSLID